MAKRSTMTIPILDAAIAEAFDTFVRERAKANKAKTHNEKAAEAKQAVLDAMGNHVLAQLPDGRKIQRVQKSRKMPARPAKVDQWDELFVVSEET